MTTIFTLKPTIEGLRVKLRPIRAQDAPIVHRMLQDAEAAILTGDSALQHPDDAALDC